MTIEQNLAAGLSKTQRYPVNSVSVIVSCPSSLDRKGGIEILKNSKVESSE